ncbi:mechanosensitive ion channel family protein [Treponema pectinovorum]|uniref:mechanosensitive ion channel family protein n=1 Tax=Treponema pectinovorum TaxID=164 RepID=UPI0011C82933|nr:mechanosensitive ion channel domain-containing protein [Treponema pectinovorum]
MEENLTDSSNLAFDTASHLKSIFYIDELKNYFTAENLTRIITSLISILFFWLIYRAIRHFVTSSLKKSLQKKTVLLIERGISYCFYAIISMFILGLFGIKLNTIWGAAGIAGIAIGFAAQTSISNLISGIFVVTDRAMKIGDFIEVEDVSGTVDRIGIISIKIRTLDNQEVRIPNSTIINSKLINYSGHKHRRYVFSFNVDYFADLDKVIEILLEVPKLCPSVILDEEDYAPKAFCALLSETGVTMNLIVWGERVNFLKLKGEVCLNTINSLKAAGISIAFNRTNVNIIPQEK